MNRLIDLMLDGYKDDSFIGLGSYLFITLWDSDQSSMFGSAYSILSASIPCDMVQRWLAE